MPKALIQVALGLWGITPGNYSGITPVQDNVYAIVDDKDAVDGFQYLTLDFDLKTGKLLQATLQEPEMMQLRRQAGEGFARDPEGICFHPGRQTLFISGEADQAILEYNLQGKPTGASLAVPPSAAIDKIASNYGFEALSYNEAQHLFWSVTEGPLLADGSALPTAAPQGSTPLSLYASQQSPSPKIDKKKQLDLVNEDRIEIKIPAAKQPAEAKHAEADSLAHEEPIKENLLRLLSFDEDLRFSKSFVYQMDTKKSLGRKGNGVHGVSSILALDNGQLIVMEREGFCPRWRLGAYVNIKLYLVNISEATPIPLDADIRRIPQDLICRKQLLAEFKTKFTLFRRNLANYEGMCLGPELSDGTPTLLLIADSQKGQGNFLFRLKDYLGILKIDKSTTAL
ncbi:MAG: esterase-like activity of phytase family protein [Bacteroidales bacterium]|nr:esterase-like activity of phytase family protein [Bacteroidales bacterium]